MTFTFRANMRFTSCTRTAMDPVIYEPLDDNQTWKRWERTMKGEQTVVAGTILVAWEEASKRQRNLARTLDQLLDERPFLQVDLFDDLFQRLRRQDSEEPDAQGILVMVETPEPWQAEGKPTRHCSIDWLDSIEVERQEDVQVTVDRMLERLDFHEQILAIRTFLINTEDGGYTELAYEIPIPAEFQPQLQTA